jgi:hypothetical protein
MRLRPWNCMPCHCSGVGNSVHREKLAKAVAMRYRPRVGGVAALHLHRGSSFRFVLGRKEGNGNFSACKYEECANRTVASPGGRATIEGDLNDATPIQGNIWLSCVFNVVLLLRIR